jgi:uncharacterized protein (TIGR00269 family)
MEQEMNGGREMKEFAAAFEAKVKGTIEGYGLLSKKDKPLVACSGGKDSTTTLYLLKKFGYKPEAVMINLFIGEWSEKNLKNITKFCKDEGIKLHVVSLKDELGYSMCYIRSVVKSKSRLKNCTICGVIRKWLLNKKARELGATKLVTGHNVDDEARTVLMNILNGNLKLGMGLGPKTGIIEDERFIQRVKPLYFCREEDVRKYSMFMEFPVLYEKCPCSEGAFGVFVRNELKKLEDAQPGVKEDIVKNFLELQQVMRKNYKPEGKLKYCKVCGEPSRNDVCKACEVLGILRS